MSKFRPNLDKSNIFIIPDIHGRLEELKLITSRILPLRKSEGILDKLVILGDLIDRGPDSAGVIDHLIEIKEKYGDQVVILRGNHDAFALRAVNLYPGNNLSLSEQDYNYRLWRANGGLSTIVSYLKRQGDEITNVLDVSRAKVKTLIPKEHWDLFLQAVNYHIEDNFWFVHGGCAPSLPLEKQEPDFLMWDRKLCKMVINCIALDRQKEIDWEQIIFCGHSGPKTIIHPKFCMLDAGLDELLVVEARSLEAYAAKRGNNRLIKRDLQPTVKTPGLVKRAEYLE